MMCLLALTGMFHGGAPSVGAAPQDPAPQDDERAALATRRDSLSDAITQGDATAVAAHFCVDARLIVPGFDAVTGRAAIQQAWQFALGGGNLTRLVLAPEDLDVRGGAIIIESGMLTTFGKDGKERDRSHYLLVWKREDQEWKISRDITSPGPPPGPTADRVGYPENYRTKFKQLAAPTLNSRGLVQTPFGNAMAATIADNFAAPYPYGSVLVMEFAPARRDADGKPQLDPEGNPTRGDVQRVDVMRREAGFGEAYGKNRTGEWEYVSYHPDGTILVPPVRTGSCAECHVKAGAERDFVYPLK